MWRSCEITFVENFIAIRCLSGGYNWLNLSKTFTMAATDKKYFSERRTVRRYRPDAIDDSLVRNLLELAAHAPNTGNMQLYSAVVTTDEETKKRLAPAHFNQPQVTECSHVVTFCADYRRYAMWCRISDADPGCDNFQSFMAAVIDTCLFAQQFNTLAEMNGLGCCYLGTTTYNAPEIGEVLELPQLVVPITTITVGYPEGDAALSDRLPVESIVMDNKYKTFDESAIRKFYSEKESLEESRRFVVENGKRNLAQVYAEVRYPRASAEIFSAKFLEYVRKQGFNF